MLKIIDMATNLIFNWIHNFLYRHFLGLVDLWITEFKISNKTCKVILWCACNLKKCKKSNQINGAFWSLTLKFIPNFLGLFLRDFIDELDQVLQPAWDGQRPVLSGFHCIWCPQKPFDVSVRHVQFRTSGYSPGGSMFNIEKWAAV